MNNATKAGAVEVVSRVHRQNRKMRSVNNALSIPFTEDPDDGKYLLYAAAIVAENDEEEGEGPQA